MVEEQPNAVEEQQELTPVEVVEYIFTNDPTNPNPQQILHLFYEGVFKNLVGIMHAKHKPSGEIHTVLVGLDKGGDGYINTYPLARILSREEQDEYLAPDGKGGYPDVKQN